MLKRVREKTWVVEGRREARTVEAIRAAFVERDAGNLNGERGGRLVGVGREGRGGGCLLDADAAAVVEEQDIDAHEPAAHGPDGVAGRGFGERFQDGAEG